MRDDCNFHGAVYSRNKHNSPRPELFALQIPERLSPGPDAALTIHGAPQCSNAAPVKLLLLFKLMEMFPEADPAAAGLCTLRDAGVSPAIPWAPPPCSSRPGGQI